MIGVWYAKEAIIAEGADKILPLSDISSAILAHLTMLSKRVYADESNHSYRIMGWWERGDSGGFGKCELKGVAAAL
jgi:hypothetical protein